VPLFLVRHAETASNAARIVQRADDPLSERGRDQAARLARRLAPEDVRLVLASDLCRAVTTAEAVCAATGASLELDPGLRERDYGDVRGTPYADLTADIFAPAYEPPGGETWAVFHARVDAAWLRVCLRVPRVAGPVVVVTHGLVCRAIAARHLVLPAGVAPGLARANTAVTVIDGQPPRTVRLLDCAAHLAGTLDGGPV
jgi:broad specificity phosphatase PhoE